MEPIKFFLPGPAYVSMDAREAMLQPMVAHRSPFFKDLYARMTPQISALLRTSGDVAIATGSSTLIMESAVISCVRSDVLNLTQGSFSERWHAISKALGKNADQVAVPWGRAMDPDIIRAALRRKKYEAVTLVHNETSTGAMNPLEEIARVIREESDALILVDAVSSLGGVPVETDAWGLDVVLAGTQKCIAAPPGLVVFSLSGRAAERAERVPHRGFYTDLLRYRDKHREGGPITTPGLPLVYALAVQLDRIEAEGIEARWERHRKLYEKTAGWAAARGCAYASAADARSITVSCLYPPAPPAGIDPQALVKELGQLGDTVSGGYGDWKPTTFRIGHMGEVREPDLDALLAETDRLLETVAAAVVR